MSRIAGYSRFQNAAHSVGGSGFRQHTSVSATWPVAPQQPAPAAKARFDPHVVDGTFAPDEVRAVREVETSHVRHAPFQSVRNADPACLSVQRVDERWMVVDGDDA